MEVTTNASYERLNDEEAPTATPVTVARAQPVVIVYETVEKRKRSVGCGCCLITLLVVLLCSLLVPRRPSIGFREFNIQWDNDKGYQFIADLRFKSSQPVHVDWKDLSVKLQWRLSDKTIQDVATFEQDSFGTKAFGAKHIQPSLKSGSLIDIGALYAQCVTDQVIVRFKGNVKSKDSGNKYSLETDWNDVLCYI